MDGELRPPPWWTATGALAELVEELRAAGFRVGAEHVAAAQRLALTRLAAGRSDGAEPRELPELGELLAPVMCSSPVEQDDFPDLFAAWARRQGQRERPEPPGPPVLADALVAAESRRRRWLAALALGVVVVVAAILLWPSAEESFSPPPAEGPAPEDPEGAVEEIAVAPPGAPDPSVFVDPAPDDWLPFPEEPSLRERIAAWLSARWQVLVTGGGVLGGLLAAYGLWLLRARRALQRLAVSGELDMGRLPVAQALVELFDRRALDRTARELRRRTSQGAVELDATASAERSARRGGWLTPVFRRRAVVPGYVALIERQSAADPPARLAEALLDGLDGVDVRRFFFRGDPRAVSPPGGGAPIALERLAARFGDRRLLIFAEASCFFSVRTGTLASWTGLLGRWRERAVLTPLEPARWGVRERLLARSLRVLPATPEGLGELLREGRRRWRGGARGDAVEGELARRPRRWMERRPPVAPAVVTALLGKLRRQVGEAGWYWLSACAAYPAIEWNLLLQLGRRLRGRGAALLDASRLAALGRLPWMRRAFLPDWLRARLLADLPEARRERVRTVVGELLVSAVDGVGPAVDLEVALGARSGRWGRCLWPSRWGQGAVPEVLRDEVLLRFLAGRRLDPLAVALPEGLPNVVLHLAFSPDGRRLAATLGGTNGLRVFRADDGEELFSDTDYGDQGYGASFDSSGRLVTSCFDGQLRLYDADHRQLAASTAPGGERPFAVAFSPDGRRIAVGYTDSVRVDVLSGDDLSLLWSADSQGANGNFGEVSWSADGEVLYAAGRFDIDGRSPVRRWTDAGRGSFLDLSGPANTVMGLRALADGRLVFGAQDPAWGVFDPADGETAGRIDRLSPLADFRGNEEGFRVAPDGETVSFGYESGGERPALFSLSGRRLVPDPSAAEQDALAAPRRTAPDLEIEGWENTRSVRLNGEPLRLDNLEMSRSLAIAEDGASFLLGADWSLRLFDRDGSERWRNDVPGVAWAVSLTPDGRLALAAYADGTIRWYRAGDGEELLAFFPHRDERRWVLWTPSGYYDASPGEGRAAGESLFGWTVNRGRDQAARFYSAARLEERFHRPDVIDRVLRTLDEAEAVRLADEASAAGE